MINIDEWLSNTDFSLLMTIDTECNGVNVSVYQEPHRGNDSVCQTMHLNDSGRWFSRTGEKVYSYDYWVETRWSEWSEM